MYNIDMQRFIHSKWAVNLSILLGLALLVWSVFTVYASVQALNASSAPDPYNAPDQTYHSIVANESVKVAGDLLATASTLPAGQSMEYAWSRMPLNIRRTVSSDDMQIRENSLQLSDALVPDRIVIPAINLDAPVIRAQSRTFSVNSRRYAQWIPPDERAVGWQTDSATLGEVGNTVLYGHHNIDGEVFHDLYLLKSGDLIILYSNGQEFLYAVSNVILKPERDVTLDIRLENARWIERSEDERITLVTCWPYTSNTHRLVIVATPVQVREPSTP